MASNTAMSEREIEDESIRQPNEITMKQLVDKIYNDLYTPNSLGPTGAADQDGFLSSAVGIRGSDGAYYHIANGYLKTVYDAVKEKLRRVPRAREMMTRMHTENKKKMVIENMICHEANINCPEDLDLPFLNDPIPMSIDVNGGKKKRIRSKSRRKKSSRRKSYKKKKLYKKNKRKTKRSKLKH